MHTKEYVKWDQEHLKLHVAKCIIPPMIKIIPVIENANRN